MLKATPHREAKASRFLSTVHSNVPARESDLHSEVHEKVFEPLRALVAIMDELFVATERVAE